MLTQIGTQKQQFNVLPQQIQLLKLFHLTTLELQQRIQEELNENPLLEEDENSSEELVKAETSKDEVQEYQDSEEYTYDDIPDYKLEHNNYLAEEHSERPFAEAFDFRGALKQQIAIHVTGETDVMIAEFLIDSLGDDGFLNQDTAEIADCISFQSHVIVETEQVEKILAILKELDPIGMGCRSPREFLLFQMTRMESTPCVEHGIQLLRDHFQDLFHRNMEKIAARIQISEDDLRDVIELVGTLKMKPLTETLTTAAPPIIPDFIITDNGSGLDVSLYLQRSSTLFINNSLTKMLEKEKKTDKATVTYLKSKLNSAQWFVDAIKQREATMMKIMTEIVKFQADFFKEGEMRLLKPMILKNIAEKIGMDISTVSRITCNKYAQTPFGTILLKSLFSEGVENSQGELISNRVIQTVMEEVVRTEDKDAPYTDQQLAVILSQKGFDIARRTVSKYREHLQIPIAQYRTGWR